MLKQQIGSVLTKIDEAVEEDCSYLYWYFAYLCSIDYEPIYINIEIKDFPPNVGRQPRPEEGPQAGKENSGDYTRSNCQSFDEIARTGAAVSRTTALIKQMPELALRCAQFFHSISQYCVGYYNNCMNVVI